MQVVLGHARRNRNVTQVSLNPPALSSSFPPAGAGSATYLRYIPRRDDAYLDILTKFPTSLVRRESRQTVSHVGFLRTCRRAQVNFANKPERKKKILSWQRAGLQVHLEKHSAGVRPQETSGEEGKRIPTRGREVVFTKNGRWAASLKGVWSGF